MGTQHTQWEQIFRNLCKSIRDMNRLKGPCKMARMVICLQTSTLFRIHVNGRMTSNSVFFFVLLHHALLYNCATQTKEVHIFWLNILILILDVFYLFRTREFIFRKKVLYTVLVWYVLHASVIVPNHTCVYNRFPEDEPSVSKHVEDVKIKILV